MSWDSWVSGMITEEKDPEHFCCFSGAHMLFFDSDKVDAPLYYDMDAVTNQLWLVAWSFHCSYNHTLQVHLDVQGRDEPDTHNLMLALMDTENRLIDLIRQVF